MKKQSDKKPGRPVKNIVRPINASADRIAKALFAGAKPAQPKAQK